MILCEVDLTNLANINYAGAGGRQELPLIGSKSLGHMCYIYKNRAKLCFRPGDNALHILQIKNSVSFLELSSWTHHFFHTP